MTSKIKTALLLILLSALIIFMGAAVGGRGGMLFGLILALAMNVGSYWFSDKIVLSMYHAREVGPYDAPSLHAMVSELAVRAEIPMPRVFIIPEEAPNAFATGRNPAHGVVAVTEGLLRALQPAELKGVLAHEIGHIVNRDILIQTVAGVLASVIMYVSRFALFFGGGSDEDRPNPIVVLLMVIFAPFAAMLVQMAISRSREYLADDTGARLSQNPLGLASALEKIQYYSERAPMHAGTEATAHMFIINPFSGGRLANLFSTHPPIEERIQRLRDMVR
jgi:heat shock protein HtpX